MSKWKKPVLRDVLKYSFQGLKKVNSKREIFPPTASSINVSSALIAFVVLVQSFKSMFQTTIFSSDLQ